MANEIIDLLQFCSSKTDRAELFEPLNSGAFTYAANGHIAVRVARRDGFKEGGKGHDIARVFEINFGGIFSPLPKVTLPAEAFRVCYKCSGRGKDHSCPSCTCVCGSCDGAGRTVHFQRASIGIGLAHIDALYYRLIEALPNPQIALPLSAIEPISFKFDGGEIILMPLRGQFSVHVEASAA